jgi:hypothetical protein
MYKALDLIPSTAKTTTKKSQSLKQPQFDEVPDCQEL